MAGKKKLFHVLALVLLLGVLVAEASNKENHQKKRVHTRIAPKKTASKVLFSDDDDHQMQRDEPFESSGDADYTNIDSEMSITVNEIVKESAEETIDQIAKEVLKEPLEEVAKESIEETVKETVEEVVRETVEETVKETVEEAVRETVDETFDASFNSQNENDLFIDESLNTNMSIDELLKEEVDLDWVPPRPSRPNTRPVKPPTRPVRPPPRPVRPPVEPEVLPAYVGDLTDGISELEEMPTITYPGIPEVDPLPQIRPPCQAAKRRCRSGSRRCRAAKRRCQLASRLPPLPNYRPLPADYSSTNLCGKTYYCRKGYRGPCNRNEIFTSVPSLTSLSRPVTSLRPSTCSPPTGCISSSSNVFALAPYRSNSKGYCTIRYAHKPCFGYPTNYRYSKRTRKCFPTLLFTSPRSRRTIPRCNQPNYVRCPKTNRCFPAYTKGTCARGQWLVPFGNQGKSVCRTCPCPSLADGQHIYWSGKQYGRPGCYKSHTQGPCRPGMRFVINDILTGSSSCVPTSRNLRTAKKRSSNNNRQSTYNSLMNDWNLFYGNAP